MKIALFQNLPDGGALRTVYEQVKGLSKKHTVDCYCFKYPNYKDISKYFHKIYTNDFRIDNNKSGFLKRIKEDYKNLITLRLVHKSIAKKINSQKYDIALIHTDMWTESPFVLRYLKKNNVYFSHELLRIAYEKYLQKFSDLSILKKIYEIFTRLIRKDFDYKNARSAQKIITASNYMADKIKNIYKREAKFIELGVNNKVFVNDKRKTREYILFIGKKNKVKGYDFYLKVKETLKNNANIKWIELGFDKDQAKISNDNELAMIYSKSLCLLCISRQEPLGLTALESISCETPVLAVNEGGYRETVIDGVTGYLLPRDPKTFAEKIKYLMENPDVARKMGEAGREHVKKNFTWEKHVKCLEKYLIQVANEKSSSNK